MPHWIIYHPPDTFLDVETKQALSNDITSIYTRPEIGMPAFYVVVTFIPIPDESQFVGGEVARSRRGEGKPFIRLCITHIHIRLPENDEQVYADMTGRVDAVLKPYIADKGYDWEYHIAETERLLWKLNGVYAPEWKSADEKVWVAANQVVRPEEMEGARKRLG
ncbi:uncharacterized protein SEPMUDRAFT_110171 [Sphaerulina musiva SO2202]|uniref:Tautomerase cis-CaaD-like domain-containing protein n=1 Tax=Sphaerulina musiva (strain SO2202) TaxID=692275 RepID=N1QEN5_SPHMS|nr:uncharacterized protein SEPMUDRAFT_110171 [Sphaerulina musiva SO2202]EMF10941.1 hypothetical protein SEPMUDRAFT_110171 [Sphaerulina musiva SO2202]